MSVKGQRLDEIRKSGDGERVREENRADERQGVIHVMFADRSGVSWQLHVQK